MTRKQVTEDLDRFVMSLRKESLSPMERFVRLFEENNDLLQSVALEGVDSELEDNGHGLTMLVELIMTMRDVVNGFEVTDMSGRVKGTDQSARSGTIKLLKCRVGNDKFIERRLSFSGISVAIMMVICGNLKERELLGPPTFLASERGALRRKRQHVDAGV